MDKCYIAGKISNLPKEVYTANFNEAKKQVRSMGFVPVSPVDLPHNHPDKWDEYMKEDIAALLQCNHIYALADFRQSKGANLEVNLAMALGIPIIHQL